jgi:hypothetical protein
MDLLSDVPVEAESLYQQWLAHADGSEVYAAATPLMEAFFAAFTPVARQQQGIHLCVVIFTLQSIAKALKQDLQTRTERGDTDLRLMPTD